MSAISQSLATPVGPIQNPSETGISEMSPAVLAHEVATFEVPFRCHIRVGNEMTPGANLLMMREVLGEPSFRRYTALHRAWRAARKKG